MERINDIVVGSRFEQKSIDLLLGDLTFLPKEEAVDAIVVSAFPGDYTPTPTSLIGALHRKGVSVSDLSKNKAIDLRKTFSCWLSEKIDPSAKGVYFSRILCFEPAYKNAPEDMIGDIFRTLAPLMGDLSPIQTLAMPIVTAGDRGGNVYEVVSSLLEAAIQWMEIGLPLRRLKIVAHTKTNANKADYVFSQFKKRLGHTKAERRHGYKYDFFLSYSHQDSAFCQVVVHELKAWKKDVKIFVDRMELKLGSSWQHEIFESLDECFRIIPFLSPSYLLSKVCKEEFNIAWARSRNEARDIVYPLYLYSADLPTYMTLCQYADCREGDLRMIRKACAELVKDISVGFQPNQVNQGGCA